MWPLFWLLAAGAALVGVVYLVERLRPDRSGGYRDHRQEAHDGERRAQWGPNPNDPPM